MGYSMVFVGSLEDFIMATGASGESRMPENFKKAVDILFECYQEKWGDRRGIKGCRTELFSGVGQMGDLSLLLEDIGKLPSDAAVLAKISVDNKEYIPAIVEDMSTQMGLEIEYCETPYPRQPYA